MVYIRQISSREGHSESEVMRIWLELAFRSLRGAVLKVQGCQAKWENNEAEWTKTAKRLRHPTSLELCSAALGVMTVALEQRRHDFLGELYMQHLQAKELGQFFTPPELSRLIAEMTVGHASEYQREGEVTFFNEPACGVGGMVIAADEVLRSRGVDTQRRTHWVCQDVSITAIFGAYIQLTLLGISADVVWGNTLSAEKPHMVIPTIMAVMFPKRRPAHSPAKTIGSSDYAEVLNKMVAAE